MCASQAQFAGPIPATCSKEKKRQESLFFYAFTAFTVIVFVVKTACSLFISTRFNVIV